MARIGGASLESGVRWAMCLVDQPSPRRAGIGAHLRQCARPLCAPHTRGLSKGPSRATPLRVCPHQAQAAALLGGEPADGDKRARGASWPACSWLRPARRRFRRG
eukprot:scaffold80_cov382-Prasinococcus_capsulatus_cf.AAC.8